MCYGVPIAASIVTVFVWKKTHSLKTWWLLLLFLGGSLFGFIDHLWNKELFLISADWAKDLALGAVITLGIFLTWGILVLSGKNNPALNIQELR
ncbi:MAG: hypothetical protein KKE64_08035 [Candidatus Omnitrophica bacterium]|nr:hypothetical protein [Candidatus Omnitrophota bacterium]